MDLPLNVLTAGIAVIAAVILGFSVWSARLLRAILVEAYMLRTAVVNHLSNLADREREATIRSLSAKYGVPEERLRDDNDANEGLFRLLQDPNIPEETKQRAADFSFLLDKDKNPQSPEGR